MFQSFKLFLTFGTIESAGTFGTHELLASPYPGAEKNSSLVLKRISYRQR
jgi:hypothetical protein